MTLFWWAHIKKENNTVNGYKKFSNLKQVIDTHTHEVGWRDGWMADWLEGKWLTGWLNLWLDGWIYRWIDGLMIRGWVMNGWIMDK